MPALSIIIPCHNEEKRLSVEKVLGFLQQKQNVQIIFVDDGSTDNTHEKLLKIKEKAPSQIQIISLNIRKGKAEAVRNGLLESQKNTKFTHHGFIDADLAVSLDELFRLYQIISFSERQFIFGSRIKKVGSSIIRNEWRHFYSRIIATIIGFIIKLDVYDTQCSAKIFTTGIINSFCKTKFRTSWLFDIEIICRIYEKFGHLNSIGSEEPLLNWTEIKGSKLRWYNFLKIINEILIIRKYYRIK